LIQLFDELRRRNVFRVAIAYLVASWLVLQVADLVLENIEAPRWVMQAFLLVFGLGLLIVLVFAWAYELTPDGLKKEKDVDRTRSVTHSTGKKLDQVTIVMLVGVVAFVFAERTFFSAPPSSAPVGEITATVVPDKSIAVLAFEDLSPEGDQEYFADGLAEELLNVLAGVPDLQVAGRTSSFAFKGRNKDLREIGEALNVAHILEGSVRKSGNRIRVTAQLINAADGFHLFSKSYDRNLTDVFAVQDELAAMISSALQSRLIGSDAVQAATPTEIATYELYLAARQEIHSRDANRMAEASRMLDQALVIDPEYPPALAQKALVTYLLSDDVGAYGTVPFAAALDIARPMVDKAMALDRDNAEAIAISGLLMSAEEEQTSEQRVVTLRRAVALNPGLVNAKTWLSTALFKIGENKEAAALLESIVERDPAFPPAFQNLVGVYIRTRNLDKANALVGRVERIVGETPSVFRSWGDIAFSQDEHANAIRQYRRVYDSYSSDTVLKFFYGSALRRIGEFEQILSIGMPPQKVFAHLALGDEEVAYTLLEQLRPTLGAESALSVSARYYTMLESPEAIVSYVDTTFGSVDAALEQFPRLADNSSGYMGLLAYALLQTGRNDDYQKVTVAMKLAIDSIRAAGKDFYPVWRSEAEYAALTGSDGELLDRLRYIVDQGHANALGFESPLFDRIAENDEYKELDSTVRKRANRERAKLGLNPYQQIMEIHD